MTAAHPGGRDRSVALLLLTAVIILVVVRRPELFTSPRFWAEEGALYFEYARAHGFWATLFAPHLGYFAVVPNLATALASLGAPENAPLVTTAVAALFQVLASALVIFGNAPFWDSWPKKLLLAAGIQLLGPAETWLTTIATQFWMTIAVFFVLLESKVHISRGKRFCYRLTVLLGGLSGGQAPFLTPVFALKAWRSRCREETVLTAILAATGLVQAIVVATSLAGADAGLRSRFDGINFDLATVLSLHLVKPFFSQAFFDLPAIVALDNAGAGFFFRFLPNGLVYLSLLAAMALTGGALLTTAIANRRSRDHQYLIAAFLTVVLCSTVMSLQMASAPRYAFAPAVMLLTLQLGSGTGTARFRPQRLLPALFLLLTTVSLLHDIRDPSRLYFRPGLPVWKSEVAAWRRDPSYRPMIWPPFMNRRWNVDLSGSAAP